MPSFALQPDGQFAGDAAAPDRRLLYASHAASSCGPDPSPRPRSVPDTRPERTTRGLPRSVHSARLEGVSRAHWALDQGRDPSGKDELWGDGAAEGTACMVQVTSDLKSYRLPIIGSSVGHTPH